MNEACTTNVITFREGIPGFEEHTQFMILEEGDGVFYYLQAVNAPQIILPIINPYLIKPDYRPSIPEKYFQKLGGGTTDDYIMYTVVTLRETVEESTINLQAPILIHVGHLVGIQVIVEDTQYTARHKIVELVNEGGMKDASAY